MRKYRGCWSQHIQSPEREREKGFAWVRETAREAGYRFIHVHIYQIDGLWWVDAEMEKV